jgi:hypothetical protein
LPAIVLPRRADGEPPDAFAAGGETFGVIGFDNSVTSRPTKSPPNNVAVIDQS